MPDACSFDLNPGPPCPTSLQDAVLQLITAVAAGGHLQRSVLGVFTNCRCSSKQVARSRTSAGLTFLPIASVKRWTGVPDWFRWLPSQTASCCSAYSDHSKLAQPSSAGESCAGGTACAA